MGNLFGWARNTSVRAVIAGLDGAGKTTLLYSMKQGTPVETIPTIGFNFETINYKNLQFSVWDMGGQHNIRALWKHYVTYLGGLFLVIDSTDTERFEEAKNELETLLAHPDLARVPILVYANKQDLGNAMTTDKIKERFNFDKSCSERKWRVQKCSALTGEGVKEGLEWLHMTIEARRRRTNRSWF